MSWTWRYEWSAGGPPAGADLPEPGTWSGQGDAETWVGEVWRELHDGGVAAVELLHDGASVYTMSLAPPD